MKEEGKGGKKRGRKHQGEKVSDSCLTSCSERGRHKQMALECGNSQHLWLCLLQTLLCPLRAEVGLDFHDAAFMLSPSWGQGGHRRGLDGKGGGTPGLQSQALLTHEPISLSALGFHLHCPPQEAQSSSWRVRPTGQTWP